MLILRLRLAAAAAAAATAVLVAVPCSLAAAAEPSATIDFAQRIDGQPSMSGFLHSLGATDPPPELVAPLRPRLWRGVPRTVNFARARSFGARPVVVLSDFWGYPGTNYHRHGPPWLDLERWGDRVEREARRFGPDVVWDIWNEPDSRVFWDGTEDQFALVFRTAEARLRAVLGPSTVVGPSLSHYEGGRMRRFVAACAELGCTLDALAWHELLGPSTRLSAIVSHLRDARRFSTLPLFVTEIVGQEDQTRPGALVGYFSALERGGAAGAARACFGTEGDENACISRSLNGLLVNGPVRTTSSWWATATYASGVGRRVATVRRSGGAAVLAARCGTGGGHATVLLGRENRSVGRDGWRIRLEGLRALPCVGRSKRIVARPKRMPAQNRRALERPLAMKALRAAIGPDGTATLKVPRVGPHDAVAVEIRAR